MKLTPAKRGISAVISIDDIACAGQTTCTLNRTSNGINITNKIYGDWEENLSGLKRWSVNCSAMFIKDDKCFKLLEDAFYNGDYVDVKIDETYKGKALITSFPIDAPYQSTYTYKIILKGSGALERISQD